MRKNKTETDETIRRLIAVARKHFTDKGYAASALEEIGLEAELTRGALYHHFGNKKGLFRAVLESVQKEVADRVESEAARSDDIWEQLLLGCRAFVAAAVEDRNKRVLLVDGPAVLGWDDWRMMDERNSMRLLRQQLQSMNELGCFRPVSIDAMTHSLSGALNESALWIAQMPDGVQALEDSMAVISMLLDGFKKPDR